MKDILNSFGATKVSRRHVLAGSTALAAMAAFGVTGARAQAQPLRFGIFGNAEKLEIRSRSVAHYAAMHPELNVVYEGVPSDAWPDKIAAMLAGGNAPDTFALSSGDLEQFGTRGALEPLDGYIPDILQADLFDENVLNLGRVDGVLYGIPIAVAIQGMAVNRSALERLGMGPLPENWTQEEFAEYCAEIHKADPSMYGCHDGAARLMEFQMKLASEGRELINGDELAVTVDEVADWLETWNKMRETGAAVPADLQAQFTGTEWPNSPVVRGRAVFAQMQSQEIAGGYQALMTDTMDLVLPPAPTSTGNLGLFPRPTSSMAVSARGTNKEEAVRLADWFCTAPESASILGLVSGPPAARPALEAVLQLDDLSEIDAKVLRYCQVALPLANPAPKVHRAERELGSLMRRVNENVGFGTYGVQEGAEEFVSEGTKVMQRG